MIAAHKPQRAESEIATERTGDWGIAALHAPKPINPATSGHLRPKWSDNGPATKATDPYVKPYAAER
ncbi:hypothetical protein GCM10023157_05350 [Gluconacetobacter asukensis]